MRAAARNRKVQIFESSIERLGRILSKKWKIKVVFKHGECSTNGNVIFLPVLPDNASKDLMDAMQGHLDHEAAHVAYSDFKLLDQFKRKPKTFTVFNALEDPRIEKKWGKVYPGAKVNMHRALEWSCRRVAEEREMVDPEDGQKKMMRPWDGLSDLGKFLYTASVWARVYFDKSFWFLNEVVDPALWAEVQKHEDLLKAAVACDESGDVTKVVEELMKRLKEEEKQNESIKPEDLPDDAIVVPPGMGPKAQDRVMQKQPKPDPNAPPVYEMEESDEEGEDGEAAAGGEGEESEDGESGDATGGDSDDVDQPFQHGGGDGLSSPDWEPSNEELERDAALTSMNTQLKEAAIQSLKGDDRYMVYSTEGDKVERMKEGNRSDYKRFMDQSMRLIAPIKRKLARSLLSTNVAHWETDKTRGKINPRRLYQVGLGTSKRVFRQRVESESFDTCVLMMIDHSGSMSGSQLNLAAQTAIVLGETLNQLGIPFSVLGFSTGDNSAAYGRYQKASNAERDLYTRWGNLWIGEYKNFEDPWGKAGAKMIGMARQCRQNTYDGESLRYGAQLLLARPEKRKIMFWLNDGSPCPNSTDDSSAHWQYALDCAKEIEKRVELFAIGVGCDISSIYTNAVQIDRLEDLSQTCLNQLDALIRKGKTFIKKKAA